MKPTLLGLAFKAPLSHPQPAFPASSPSQLGFFPNMHTSPAHPWAFPPAAPSAWDALPLHFSKIQFPPLEVPQDFLAEDIISALRSHRPLVQELLFYNFHHCAIEAGCTGAVFDSDCHQEVAEPQSGGCCGAR